MKKDRLYKGIIALLCVVLGVSMYFNFRSPFLPSGKAQHLGNMTYVLPEDGKWVSSGFPSRDTSYGVDAQTGRVLRKSYIDTTTLTQVVVSYNVLGISLDDKDIIEWSDTHGAKPVGAEGLQTAASEVASDFDMYAHWCATFTLDGKLYMVDVYGTHINRDEAIAMGELFVSSINLDSKLTDEYKR